MKTPSWKKMNPKGRKNWKKRFGDPETGTPGTNKPPKRYKRVSGTPKFAYQDTAHQAYKAGERGFSGTNRWGRWAGPNRSVRHELAGILSEARRARHTYGEKATKPGEYRPLSPKAKSRTTIYSEQGSKWWKARQAKARKLRNMRGPKPGSSWSKVEAYRKAKKGGA